MTHIEIDLTKPARPQRFVYGQYVLYRDPDLYWAGKPDHTFPCRVLLSPVFFELRDLRTGRSFRADPNYARLLPAEDCMRDIDAAPLASDDPGLHPAAVAWLQQNTKPEVA